MSRLTTITARARVLWRCLVGTPYVPGPTEPLCDDMLGAISAPHRLSRRGHCLTCGYNPTRRRNT